MIYTYIINPLLKHLIFQSTGRLHKNHEATYQGPVSQRFVSATDSLDLYFNTGSTNS